MSLSGNNKRTPCILQLAYSTCYSPALKQRSMLEARLVNLSQAATHQLYPRADKCQQMQQDATLGGTEIEDDEKLNPDLLRGRDKLIDRDLDVYEEDSEQNFEPLQLHHCSVGY
jgi:hypothetical protein